MKNYREFLREHRLFDLEGFYFPEQIRKAVPSGMISFEELGAWTAVATVISEYDEDIYENDLLKEIKSYSYEDVSPYYLSLKEKGYVKVLDSGEVELYF